MSRAQSPAPVRAAFLKHLPQGAEVEELVQLFEQGNYAGLRERAAQLGSSDPEVVAAARELVARTRPDTTMSLLFALTGLLLLVVTAFAYGQP